MAKMHKVVAFLIVFLCTISCLSGYVIVSSETFQNQDLERPYNSTLRYVNVIFRHGARNPVRRPYNSDPHRNYTWPGGLGALTNVGKRQMYELGCKFRMHYEGYLPDAYNEEQVNVRSSDSSRCMMSAALFLAGLYPPQGPQTWNEDLNWQPIPVRSLPSEMDNMLSITKECPLKLAILERLFTEAQHNQAFEDLYGYLSNKTNETVDSLLGVLMLYSTLKCELEAGLSIPFWTDPVYPHKMAEVVKYTFSMFVYNDTLKRLVLGPLLDEMKSRFDSHIKGADKGLLQVYSAHEINIASLWLTLGFEELLEPDYGSSLVLELHEIDVEEFYIEVYFWNNTSVDQPLRLKLPFCEDPCSYSDFIRYIDRYIPVDWEKECKQDKWLLKINN